jgi:nucleotide-binding universal stress UspA family protein
MSTALRIVRPDEGRKGWSGMIGYKDILYCTDYSEDAELALVYAVDLAKRYGSRLHVLHVLHSWHRYLPTEVYEGVENGGVAEATPELIERVTRDIQKKYHDQLEGHDPVVYSVLPGNPHVEILRYAREKEVDLIVMGSMGRSEQQDLHYGSTVEQVSKMAHCHVMAIRNPEKLYTL